MSFYQARSSVNVTYPLPSEVGFVSGHWDGKARVWSLETGQVERVFEPSKATEVSVLDEERVLLANSAFETLVVDKQGTVQAKLDIHAPPALEMAWSSEGTMAAGDLAGARETLKTIGTVMGLTDVWRGALEHMKP